MVTATGVTLVVCLKTKEWCKGVMALLATKVFSWAAVLNLTSILACEISTSSGWLQGFLALGVVGLFSVCMGLGGYHIVTLLCNRLKYSTNY